MDLLKDLLMTNGPKGVRGESKLLVPLFIEIPAAAAAAVDDSIFDSVTHDRGSYL